MDKSFAHYYSPTEDEFKTIWEDCIFIFDTNVLLNIYEYSEENRKIFFDILTALKERIWIPYHVGLEFHRNRFSRIRDAGSTLSELKKGVETARTLLMSDACTKPVNQLKKKKIDIKEISDRVDAIHTAVDDLTRAIDAAKGTLPRASMSDEIGKKVSELFTGKVGERPATQEDLQALVSDADSRMSNNIPPGFEDKGKGNATFLDHGIRYSNKHGDLIIWKQIIAHAKKDRRKSIVFVTGDSKSDWWLCEGPLTLGPRIELIQEITSESGIPHFWMYNVDKFLEYSRDILKIRSVTSDFINQTKDIVKHAFESSIEKKIVENISRSLMISKERYDLNYNQQMHNAIYEWLKPNNNLTTPYKAQGYDYSAKINGVLTCFDLRTIQTAIALRFRICQIFDERIEKSSLIEHEEDIHSCLIIASNAFVDSDVEALAREIVQGMNPKDKSAYQTVFFGKILPDNSLEITSQVNLT